MRGLQCIVACFSLLAIQLRLVLLALPQELGGVDHSRDEEALCHEGAADVAVSLAFPVSSARCPFHGQTKKHAERHSSADPFPADCGAPLSPLALCFLRRASRSLSLLIVGAIEVVQAARPLHTPMWQLHRGTAEWPPFRKSRSLMSRIAFKHVA